MKQCIIISLMLVCACAKTNAQTETLREPVSASTRLVRFFPNPAASFIQFECKKNPSQALRLRVYNFLGRKVLDLPRMQANTKIDLSTFTRGVYIFQITDAEGQLIESGKFLIER